MTQVQIQTAQVQIAQLQITQVQMAHLQIIARIALVSLYAAPAWHGFASAQDIERVEGLLRKSKRWGLCGPGLPLMQEQWAEADSRLFANIIASPSHTLYHLFKLRGPSVYNLRPGLHPFMNPRLSWSKLTDSNYAARML